MSYNSKYTGAVVEQLLEKIGMKLSGKINLTSIDEVKAAQSALNQTNDVAFYLVTDSSGKIPSSQGCYNIPSDIVKQLSLTSPNSITNGVLALATSSVSINAVGVNVGDLVALTRVRVKVSDLTAALGISLSLSGEIEIYQYKILSMNDAKPSGHWEASAGVMGLMSPWDKVQVNKISGIESTANNALPKNDLLPSRWEANMNNALQTGVYPWCDLGRPAGSTGHYTCIVNRTSTDDGAFNTIEQTAYGREAELGQVYKRIIFEKTDGTDAQFGEWVKVSNVGLDIADGSITTAKIKDGNVTLAKLSADVVDKLTYTVDYSLNYIDSSVYASILASKKVWMVVNAVIIVPATIVVESSFLVLEAVYGNTKYSISIVRTAQNGLHYFNKSTTDYSGYEDVYSKEEIDEKLGDINTILESIING